MVEGPQGRSATRWRLGRRPELDGIRAVAVTLVVLEHCQVPGMVHAGGVGVTMFFTLSGFLITSLLLEERAASGRIDMVRFYKRRILRLLPALYASLLAALVLALLLDVATGSTEFLASVVLYSSNWLMAMGPQGLFGHTWSLSVEEQFYLTWPVVVLLAARRVRLLFWLAVAGSVGSVLLRVALWNGGVGERRIYFGTDARADALLLGCALAIGLHQTCSRRSHPVAASGMLGCAALWLASEGFTASVVQPFAVAVLTAAAIWLLVRGPVSVWLQWSPLRAIGQRSYGLYLWHYPIAEGLRALTDYTVSWPALLAVTVLLSGLATELSWRYVEQPLLRRRPEVRLSQVDQEGSRLDRTLKPVVAE